MPKIEREKIDCLHRPCSRPAPQGKIKSVRTHSEVIEQFDSFSLLKLLFLVRNWHCWSRKAFTRQMTPQIREETAKTAVFRQRWQAWKVVRSIAAVRQRPRTPRNWRCSFAFFESFLWHFNEKQHAEVIFRLSRPVLCKNQENGSGKQWSLHAPLKLCTQVRIGGRVAAPISGSVGNSFRPQAYTDATAMDSHALRGNHFVLLYFSCFFFMCSCTLSHSSFSIFRRRFKK